MPMTTAIDPRKKLGLYNPIFDGMRNALDLQIQQTIRDMMRRGMTSGAVTLKIDIAFEDGAVQDDNEPTGTREVVTPDFGYKISSVIQDKDECKDDIIRHGSGKEIVKDSTGAFFLLDHAEASGQLNIFSVYDGLDGENDG